MDAVEKNDIKPHLSRYWVIPPDANADFVAYMEDVLYFPIPETGLNGVPLRLMFRDRELSDPIQVVFEVPLTLGIFEKRKAAREEEKGEDTQE